MRLPQLRASAWLLTVAAIFGITLIVGAVLLDVVATRSEREQQSVASRLEELGRTQLHVEKLLLDVETGQRGYLLTSRPEFLEPYEAARVDLPAQLTVVDELAALDPAQTAAARQLRALTDAKLAITARSIGVHRAQGPAASRALVSSGQGKRIMDELRSVIVDSTRAGEASRERYADRARAVGEQAAYVRAGAATVLCALLGLMLWLVRQREGAEERRRADEQARQELLAELEHQAVHDPLTGLPNRRLLEDRITQALGRCARDGTLLALLFIDLDRFKHVNDRYGHGVGDHVLVAVAERLRAMLRGTDSLARMGGDEFVALCEQLPDESAALTLVTDVQAQLTYRLRVDDVDVDVTASVGMVVADRNGIRLGDLDGRARAAEPPTVEALLAAADEAMYHAKTLGRARHHVYSAEVARNRSHRVALGSDLQEALAGDPQVGGRLWVAFQPLVRLDTGAAVGVEALCRWSHPERGEISPAEFIPVAESSGLISALGDLVLQTACRQVSAWNGGRAADGLPPLYVSVNCSARQLLHPGYTDRLARVLADTGTDPRTLVIELTESVLVDTVTGAGARLQSLSELGVRLALDDFGTGYSSLAYLRRFPFDIIKIDRSFAAGLGKDPEDEAIVASVVGMATALRRTLVVEGIETAAQGEHARRLGCHFAQGYHYGRPQPAQAFDAALRVPAERAHERT